MQQKWIRRLVAGTALVAVALPFLPSSVAVMPAWAAAEKEADVDIHSFAAAFLAAQTADADFDTKSAIRFYRKALEYDPGNDRIRERLMVDLFIVGDFDGGVSIVEALAGDPAIDQVRQLATTIELMREGDFDGASKLPDVTTSNPIDRLLNALMKAWGEAGAGKGKEAVADLRSLEGPPWYPIFTEYHAGAIAELSGDTAMARSIYQDAIVDKSIAGAAPDTYVRTVMALAALEARQGNVRAALDTLATGEQVVPNYAPLAAMRQRIEGGGPLPVEIENAADGAASALFSLGSAVNREGAEETVILYLQFARALDPDNASALVTLGNLKETIKQPEEAIELYKMVPEDSPMRRISEMQLGLALSDMDEHTEAREHLKALIAEDPKDIRSYLAYGSVLSEDKAYEEMADNYEKALAAVGPAQTANDWNLYFQLGIAYERLKQWPKAEKALKRALELQPNQPQVMNYLGYSWVDMNMNLEEGMDMIRNAVDLRPNDGYIVDSLGWAHYKLGQYEDAVRELERAVELKPADPTINDHLGDAYWRVGRKTEAGFQWNRALIGDPEPDLKAEVEKKIADGLPEKPAAVPAAGNQTDKGEIEAAEPADDRT
jgi:tetratricopeptide (TPR) repeat protein